MVHFPCLMMLAAGDCRGRIGGYSINCRCGNTMAKHRKLRRLSHEQRREIALLANAGISHKLLAKDYKVSIHTIHSISGQRRKWIEEQIATKKKQRFRYAQKIYPQMNPGPRKYIFDLVYEPVIKRIQKRLVGESQERLFFKAVLGPKSLPDIDKKTLAKYRARIRKHALVLIHDDTKKQAIYDNLKQAVVDMSYLIAELEEASLRSGETKIRYDLRKGMNQVLKRLTSRERKIVKLRYGIEDGYIHILKEIGRIFQISKERVRQIESEAIEKLQHPGNASKLKKLIDSPALRRFVQRPLFSKQ